MVSDPLPYMTAPFPPQTHAIMGTNGSGKSTLSKCLVGHPDYEVTAGSGVCTAHITLQHLRVCV